MNDSSFSICGSDDFPAVDRALWQQRVDDELKGGDSGRMLYTEDDLPALWSCTRSSKGWDICQLHLPSEPERLNALLREDLRCGVDALWLRIDRATRLGLTDSADPHDGQDGTRLRQLADLDQALREIPLENLRIILDCGGNSLPAAATLLALLQKHGLDPRQMKLVFAADPLSALASDGQLPTSLERCLEQLATLARYSASHLDRTRAVMVSSVPYHDAGAHAIQELGFLLATSVQYLRAMTDQGLTAQQALGEIAWSMAIGRGFFTGLAKLRAARLLWGKLTCACSCDPAPAPWLHAVTSRRAMTRRDHWGNMLRVTTEACSAISGGADCITTAACDDLLGEPDDLGRRLARNTQTILGEESHIGKVIDPAGGSYYIESLTDELARAAWTLFQEIEASGGMVACLQSGFVRELVDRTWTERLEQLATRREPITGISEFPDRPDIALDERQEDLDDDWDVDDDEHIGCVIPEEEGPPLHFDSTADPVAACIEAAAAGETVPRMSQSLGREEASATLEALPIRRDASPFELLRDITDMFDLAGERPKAFLACVGPPAEHRSRATFMQNLFMVGGLEVEIDAGAEAGLVDRARNSGATVVCICGADSRYVTDGLRMAERLQDAGVMRLWLAGRPGDAENAFREAGVERFVSAGCDVLELLRELLGVTDLDTNGDES